MTTAELSKPGAPRRKMKAWLPWSKPATDVSKLKAELKALKRQAVETDRQIKQLERLATGLMRSRGNLILSPPPELRLHVGRVTDMANFWAQGQDSSSRVIEVFGEDPGGLVLDWGCGVGRTLQWLDGRGTWRANYRGCDVDEAAIAWLKSQGVASVEACSDLPPLPYPDDHFVGLFCFSVLTHIHPERHRAWYQEIRRVLKPGGRAYVTVHSDANMIAGKSFTDEEKAAYFAKGWSFSEREGHYKHAATVTEAATRQAVEGLLEVERYRPVGYHRMDDLVLRKA
jgi:SAM-dependent methyltransferase